MPESRRPSAATAIAARTARLPIPVANAAAREIVWAHLDANPIAKQDANAEFAHLAAGIGQQLVPVIELDFELRIGQRIDDGAVHLDGVVFGHEPNLSSAAAADFGQTWAASGTHLATGARYD